MTRTGQGASLQVMFGVIIVTALSLFLFVTQTSTTTQNVETFIESASGFQARALLLPLYDISYMVPAEENEELATVLSYGCEYGDQARRHRYVLSESDQIVFEPERYLERILNRTVTGSYYFYVDCNETAPGGVRLEAGTEPPDDVENILVTQMDVPLAKNNRTEAFLQRWR